MATHGGTFSLYDPLPAKVQVWCSPTFRQTTGALFARCGAAEQTQFVHVNALVKQLAQGEQLSAESFPREGGGYAFKAGALRFYGAFSNAWPGCFVLSHAIIKRRQKLAAADLDRLLACRDDFDRLAALPVLQGMQ